MKRHVKFRVLLSAMLFAMLIGATFSQSVTFNVAGTNPRCQEELPNGAPYSGIATAPSGALLIVDVTFQIQVQSGSSWDFWGPPFVRIGSGSYSNNSTGATQLTLTPVHVIRMRAIIRYRNVANGPILTVTAFSAPVQYNYFPAPSFSLGINGQPVAPPPVVAPFYICTGEAMLQTMDLSNISGTGVQWRLTIFHSLPGSSKNIPSEVNKCGWQNGPPPAAGINVTSLEAEPAFAECPIRPHIYNVGEIMSITLEVKNDCGTFSQTIQLQIFPQPSGATVNFFFRGSNQADSYALQGPNNQTPTGEQNPVTGTASQTDGVLSWGGTDANPTWVGASQTSLDVSGTGFYGGVLSWKVEIFVSNNGLYILVGTYTDNTPGNTQINIQNVVMSINGAPATAGYFTANFNSSATGVLGKKFKVKLTGNGVCDQEPSKEGYFRITPDQPWWLVGGGSTGDDPVEAGTEYFQVMPNPVQATATLEAFSGEESGAMLRIVGMDGQFVQLVDAGIVALAKGFNNFTIDVSHLPSGLYSVQLVRPEKVLTAKLVKL